MHQVGALQSEHSSWMREPKPEIILTLEELSIGLGPFSPLAKRFLTGKIGVEPELDPSYMHNSIPRFAPQEREINRKPVSLLRNRDDRYSATSAQIGLVWLLA